MVEQTVIVRGRGVRGHGIVPIALGAVLVRLAKSLHGAVNVAFSGSSRASRRGSWVREAGQVEFRDAHKTGDEEMALYFEAPRFGEVAQEYFAQPTLFAEVCPKAEETAFDALRGAAADVLAGLKDSGRFDAGLLRRFYDFGAKAIWEEIDGLEIVGNRPTGGLCIGPALVERAAELYRQTPQPARVRIAGKLDLIQASTCAFLLVLKGGERVRGILHGSEFEILKQLVGADVVASGMAVYRPSGALLRIDADALAPQQPGDRLFTSVPPPRDGKLNLQSLLREQKRRGGMTALWGKVPAEESDDEFMAAIMEMD